MSMREQYEADLISEAEYLEWLYTDDDGESSTCCPYYPNCGHEV